MLLLYIHLPGRVELGYQGTKCRWNRCLVEGKRVAGVCQL
jgi:hypothetical protein